MTKHMRTIHYFQKTYSLSNRFLHAIMHRVECVDGPPNMCLWFSFQPKTVSTLKRCVRVNFFRKEFGWFFSLQWIWGSLFPSENCTVNKFQLIKSVAENPQFYGTVSRKVLSDGITHGVVDWLEGTRGRKLIGAAFRSVLLSLVLVSSEASNLLKIYQAKLPSKQ